ncbi:TPA: hypothetical protein N0F65_008431 [Lagenidium giganteum]|uniref:Uncharacterized protein n=1 Tax=Lagenidium giganteum TaxID=4803 RepID=A0AAV2YMP6_9STRA|nr:TPA: hypothetical protein N0F65_008431 [Lagenidium giganteum]
MQLYSPALVAALAASSLAVVSCQTTPAPTPAAAANGATYKMTPVRVIHARIQNDAPKWDEEAKQLYTSYAKNFTQGYQMALDGVNTASVEGALVYMQSEGIDVTHQSTKCERKNKMAYVVFYDVTFAQPNATLAQYQEAGEHLEYGPYLSFDGGKCTEAGDESPKDCLMMNGEKNTADIGPFVGMKTDDDPRAPYPDALWFSLPSSCPTMGWKDQKADCRAKSHRVICGPDETPDGVNCIFKYKILGYLGLDDLVGITAEGKYQDYKEFCEAGNIEFKTDGSGALTESIEFWKDPKDKDANKKRAEKMLEAYDDLVQGKSTINTVVPKEIAAHFEALPKPETLAEANPPCYKNAFQCATKSCKRTGYSQMCVTCSDESSGCTAPPSEYTFPTLAKAVAPVTGSSSSAQSGRGDGSGASAKSDKVASGNSDKDTPSKKSGSSAGNAKSNAAPMTRGYASAAAVALALFASLAGSM